MAMEEEKRDGSPNGTVEERKVVDQTTSVEGCKCKLEERERER
jgi:hypothetical protein